MVASLLVEVPGDPPFEVRLDPDVVTIGRAESNVLGLRDMNVSRHHFTIERRGEFYVIQDRGSRNGTLVNGVAVLNKVLEEGDKIHVGSSALTFRPQATPRALRMEMAPRPSTPRTQPLGSPIPQPGGPLTPLATQPFSKPAPTFINRARPTPGPTPHPLPLAHLDTPSPSSDDRLGTDPGTDPSGERPAFALEEESRWRKLAEVACAINMELDLDRLLEKILDAVLTLVPAKSAFLVLREGDEDALIVKASVNAAHVKLGSSLDVAGEAHRLSRQVCREAIQKKRPVLTQDAVSDKRLNQFLSVVNLQLKSILCVPFASQDEVLGVVYLDEPECDPFEDDGEVVQLVAAFGDLAGIALANARLMQEIAARERLEQEMEIASRIQRSLLPTEAPDIAGLEIAGKTEAARQVGGDIYDYFARETPQRDVLISIGDVAGKGVGAGMVMATVRSLLHAYAEVYSSTSDLLIHLNAVLSQNLDPGIFVSFLLMRYDPQDGRLYYTGAGHEHLVLYRPSTSQLKFIRAGGVVLGLVDDLEGRVKEVSMRLQPGDVICLYTDGATEAPNAEGEEFGLDRIGEAVKAGPLEPAAIVDRVMQAAVAFSGEGSEMHDDLTVVALRKT